jgi:hypothetical protein
MIPSQERGVLCFLKAAANEEEEEEKGESDEILSGDLQRDVTAVENSLK